MGGYGSGWHGGDGRPYRRMRVSECQVVLTAEQVRHSLLEAMPEVTAPGYHTAKVSTTPEATITVELIPHPIYRGGRLLLICPSCGHRVTRLYQPFDGWPLACRVCHRLAYRSTQESRKMPAGLIRELLAGMM